MWKSLEKVEDILDHIFRAVEDGRNDDSQNACSYLYLRFRGFDEEGDIKIENGYGEYVHIYKKDKQFSCNMHFIKKKIATQ